MNYSHNNRQQETVHRRISHYIMNQAVVRIYYYVYQIKVLNFVDVPNSAITGPFIPLFRCLKETKATGYSERHR